MGIRKRLFTHRVAGHCYRLPREVVLAPSLRGSKNCLENTLKNTVGFWSCPVEGQKLDSIFLGPFQPRIF